MILEGELADLSCIQRVHFTYKGEVCVFHDLYTRFCSLEEEITSRFRRVSQGKVVKISVIFAMSVLVSNCVYMKHLETRSSFVKIATGEL
jgi:hypothetical protein